MMWKLLFTLFFIGVYAQAAWAQFSWHGYLSQGVTQSKNSLFITDNNDITAELTEVGLNGYYQIAENISVAGQANYLDGGNRFEQGVRLDYLFLDWKIPNLIQKWDAQFHLGRFKNSHWLYSVTRDVPQTRFTTVLPQSVYFDGARDIALGSNGLQATFSRYDRNNIWEVNWSYGRSSIDNFQRDFLLGEAARGNIKQNFVNQASVFWQPSTMKWKIGASWLSSDFTYKSAREDNLIAGKVNIRRFMLKAQYFAQYWEVSSELIREIQKSQGLFSLGFNEKKRGEGGFIQVRYLFNQYLSGLIGFDTYVNNVSDPDGLILEAVSGGTIPSYFGYQDTTTLGFRYDIAPKWRLQGEYHWVNGATRVVNLLDRDVASKAEKEWEMWSLQLMYWF